MIADYGNNRFYKIHDIDFKKKPTSTFLKDGKNVTYIEYFEKSYKMKIFEPNQPLFVYQKIIRNKQEGTEETHVIHLVPELCKICGITEDMKTNRNFMKDLAVFTKLEP